MREAPKPVSYSGNPGNDGAMIRATHSHAGAAFRGTGGAVGFWLYNGVSNVSNRRTFAAVKTGPES
jgi:hypothetical protein